MKTTKTLAKKLAQFALEKKAHDVVVMDLREVTDMTDFFVICSADSDVQVKAVADSVMEGTEKIGMATWHSEGFEQRQWILLDYVDIVVHVFHKDARKFYSLEKIWGDAKIEKFEDEALKPKTRSRKKADVETADEAKPAKKLKKAQ